MFESGEGRINIVEDAKELISTLGKAINAHLHRADHVYAFEDLVRSKSMIFT
jgi:hypothetical protein